MNSVLEDFYFGEIQPNIHDYKNDPQFTQAMNKINFAEEKLTQLLEGNEKKIILDLINAYDEITGIISLNCFFKGL